MDIQIINTPLELTVYGFSGTAVGKDYAGTAFKLCGRMWDVVKENKLPNKGMNIWVYEEGHEVFAGVELNNDPLKEIGLEQKRLYLPKYAYCKHIGPYHLIKQAGQQMQNEISRQGLESCLPYIEIYGHWTEDENKLETELLTCLR